mmetsp:Transcript_39806/g.95541  ORF Transcript_39806/g.95541 Transcript_39806/m.95541 type:complete len:102 (+) Transcript_39806:321-626(+)
MTVCKRWAMAITVAAASCWRITCWTCASVAGSTFDVGSSMTISVTFLSSARAKVTSCCSPADKVLAFLFRTSFSPPRRANPTLRTHFNNCSLPTSSNGSRL